MKRKTGITVSPRSLNPGKAIAMAICPIICSFYYLARALMHDVACEFACAVGCAETISANVLKTNQRGFLADPKTITVMIS